eukprot:jgi/Mesen1/6885/ME000353S05914
MGGQGPVEEPLLLRVARGEDAERTPVWLMRQAGRYMADFRKYSDKHPFRMRSETAEIAIELSLQPWRSFKTDGVIMFSDILTILPAVGVEFDMVKGKGPVIGNPVRSADDLRALRRVARAAAAAAAAAAACCRVRKPELLHGFLRFLEDALVVYVCHQIDCGAQIVQLFDSWAHHLSPAQFAEFSLPYAQRVIDRVRELRPGTPLIFHANGGTGKLHQIAQGCTADVVGLDWATEIGAARETFGPDRVIQGNVDPMILFGPEEAIRAAVADNIRQAGSRRHILNVGHGVIQGTPEEAVALFCQLARESGQQQKQAAPEAEPAISAVA